jgi:hypothetical protein
MKLTDPLFLKSSADEARRFFTAYTFSLALGHTIHSITIKSVTIKQYLTEAGKRVFEGRKRIRSLDKNATISWLHPLQDPDNIQHHWYPSIKNIINEVKRWEEAPNRREPLTKTMIIHQKTRCIHSQPHSVDNAMYDWEVIGIYAGPRLAEWAQADHVRTVSQVLTNPFDGLPRAFILDDVEFFADSRRRLSRPTAFATPLHVQQIDVCWRWQKNGTRNEKKTFLRIPGDPLLCAVSAWLRITQRYQDLGVPNSYPLALFTDTGLLTGTVEFLRPSHIEFALRSAARHVYNITDEAALAKFTSHSIRVGACCALHAAGVSTMDIQYALRWKSTAFTVYLRNLPTQAARCADAVLNFDPTTFSLIPNS